jgi:hypothetical protein
MAIVTMCFACFAKGMFDDPCTLINNCRIGDIFHLSCTVGGGTMGLAIQDWYVFPFCLSMTSVICSLFIFSNFLCAHRHQQAGFFTYAASAFLLLLCCPKKVAVISVLLIPRSRNSSFS